MLRRAYNILHRTRDEVDSQFTHSCSGPIHDKFSREKNPKGLSFDYVCFQPSKWAVSTTSEDCINFNPCKGIREAKAHNVNRFFAR